MTRRGDGTVMWVVSEAQKPGIHTETSLRIGMVPLGTGQTCREMGNYMELRFSGPFAGSKLSKF